jgi:hypothetical protein
MLRKQFLDICENDHKKLYIHNDTIGKRPNEVKNIEELVDSAYFKIFKLGGEPMVTLKAVGNTAIDNMKKMA